MISIFLNFFLSTDFKEDSFYIVRYSKKIKIIDFFVSENKKAFYICTRI
jgi:hypothetical protein